MPITLFPSPACEEPEAADQLPATLPDGTVWIDMVRPVPQEVKAVERWLGISLPTREEMKEIEATSRLYCEDGARFMTSPLLAGAESDTPISTEIGFIFAGPYLVTIRDADLQSFRQVNLQFARRSFASRDQVFLSLIESIVGRQADLLERLSKETEELSARIFRRLARAKESEDNLREAIYRLGRSGDLIARERDCIVGLSRLVQYASQDDFESGERGTVNALYPRLKPVSRDLHSLSEFAGFLSSKISFMLDATLGLINIEQNSIVKIFTVAAVIFLPPTLVASIYGMNFEFMPELKLQWGYPYAIALMVGSVLLPYWFCRRKGWL